MNKLILILPLALLLATAVVCVVAFYIQNDYGGDQNDSPQSLLSPETEMIIKQDYLEFRTKVRNPNATTDNVQISQYYGTYSGCVVVKITDSFTGYHMATTFDKIDDIEVRYPDAQTAFAWKDGNFYRLQEAYNLDLLTKNDLSKISCISFSQL